jgi:hypothetical protein
MNAKSGGLSEAHLLRLFVAECAISAPQTLDRGLSAS